MPNNQMPHNLDAEAALLGCLIIDEAVQTEIIEQLHEEDFYQEAHRLIFASMNRIFLSHRTVDLVTLVDQLERDGTLERAGGLQSVTDLAQAVPAAANYHQYFEIIRRDSVNRSLIRVSREIIENSQSGPDEREAVAFAEKKIYDVSKEEDSSTLERIGDSSLVQDIIGKFEAIQADPNAFRGVETGFRQLDRITHGLQKGSLVIIAARPGVGKTSLAMNMVEYACLKKDNVAAVFSLEMPRSEIGQRLICSYAGVSMEQALSGKLVQKDWKNLLLAGDKLDKSKIYIDDSSMVTPAEILSKCRRLKSREGRLDLVMIDYIQLMAADIKNANKGGEFNRQQEIASITRSLKIMAKELQVPVIALSQLRRIQTKEAQLSDLRESGAIEQDADIVMFINRADENASQEDLQAGRVVKGAVDLVIAKHRNGSTGRIQLRFIGESTKFIDVDAQGEPEEEPSWYRRSGLDKLTSDDASPAQGSPDGEEDLPFD